MHELDRAETTIGQLSHELAGCSVVINAAGLPDAGSAANPNLMGANALLPAMIGRAAATVGAERYVHVSSAAVQGRARLLSENEDVEPFSPYSESKAFGERLLLQDNCRPASTVVLRPVSVQASSRRTTQKLLALAQSPFASVAGGVEGPAPLTLIENTAAAIVFVGQYVGEVPSVVLQPGDGLTIRQALEDMGANHVHTVPLLIARLTVSMFKIAGRLVPRLAAQARRAEMLWFGQACEARWLSEHGFVAPSGRDGWRALSAKGEDSGHRSLVAMVTIAPSVRHFLGGQLAFLKRQGFDVSVLSQPGSDLDEIASRDGVHPIPFSMHRGFSPLRDVGDLFRMVSTLRSLRPDLINYGTPKAGLLGGIAAWLTRVPARVYTLHGLRLETTTGLRRAILYSAEWVTCRSAHRVLCVSPSLRREALRLRLVSPRRALVLGSGSCNGVELDRFADSPEMEERSESLRIALGIAPYTPVVGFVGRLTRDKGIPELVEAFRQIRHEVPGTRLLLVGDFEDGDPVPYPVRREIASSNDILVTGMVPDPSAHYHLMNLLALPTHREGFPGVVLEAAAAGIPAVTTDATGAVDAVIDEVTGLRVPRSDTGALAAAITRLLLDPRLCRLLATNARIRATTEFTSDRVWENLMALYEALLPDQLIAVKSTVPQTHARGQHTNE